MRCTCLLALGLLFGPVAAQGKLDAFKFDVTTLDGAQLTQDEVKDKVVIVDFWGTWCPPCRAAVPHLVRLYEKYHDQGLLIVGLNYERVSDDRAVQKIRAFAAQEGIDYPLAIGTAAIKAQVPDFRGFPTMLFFRRGMKFDHREVGFAAGSAAKIERWVERALKDALKDKATGETAQASDKKEARKSAPAKPLNRVFQAKDGRKLTVGDGERWQLIVLVHPNARPSDAQLESLRARATKSGDKLAVTIVTRDDLANPVKALPLAVTDLARMSLGKAFPAYRLSNPLGRRVWRGAGSGGKLVAEALRRIDTALAKK